MPSNHAALPLPQGIPRRLQRQLRSDLAEVLEKDETCRARTDAELLEDITAVRAALQSPLSSQSAAQGLRVQSLALTREAARRTLGEFPYPVQVLGALCLSEGCLVEMATGEGKTLTAALAITWFALQGRGVHVATANDYLAERDAEIMGKLYSFVGLTTGVSIKATKDRRAAYQKDITYATASQLGFDHLSDYLVDDLGKKVQRTAAYAVIDEADSLLIDEARTPLVISVPDRESGINWAGYAKIVAELDHEDFEVDPVEETVYPTPSGVAKMEAGLGVENLYAYPRHVHHIQAALQARTLFIRDVDYIVATDASGVPRVVIVDSNTGRVQASRRFQNSVHEALEAKEGVAVAVPNVSLASVSIQSYFGRYELLCGMTGTAANDADEFESVYGTLVARIPTHRPVQRKDEADLLYATRDAKLRAVVREVLIRHEKGQPVLLGTPDVEESEDVSALLVEAGLDHAVLNARRPTEEAHVVAQAGRSNAITVATNMAGRGVDIKLGGDPEILAEQEANPADNPEGYHEALQRWKKVCAADKEKVTEAGGLYVLGTARYTSRRIDEQLRGRSGRQGEPGESRFYLSCEDDIVQTFGGDKIGMMVSHLAGDPDQPVSHATLSHIVERSQRRVEQEHAESRKALLAYDKVFTSQRQAVHRWRDRLLALDFEELLDDFLLSAYRTSVERGLVGTPEALEGAALEEILAPHWPHPLSLVPALEDPASADPEAVAQELARIAKKSLLPSFDAVPEEVRGGVLRHVLMQFLDTSWANHLTELDSLQRGSFLHGFAQQDPRAAFSLEAHERFADMLFSVRSRAVGALWRLNIGATKAAPEEAAGSESTDAPEAAHGAATAGTPEQDNKSATSSEISH